MFAYLNAFASITELELKKSGRSLLKVGATITPVYT